MSLRKRKSNPSIAEDPEIVPPIVETNSIRRKSNPGDLKSSAALEPVEEVMESDTILAGRLKAKKWAEQNLIRSGTPTKPEKADKEKPAAVSATKPTAVSEGRDLIRSVSTSNRSSTPSRQRKPVIIPAVSSADALPTASSISSNTEPSSASKSRASARRFSSAATETSVEELPNLRRSTRVSRQSTSGPFASSSSATASIDTETIPPPAAESPSHPPPSPAYSFSDLLVDAWTAFWDSFWTHYRILTMMIILICITVVVVQWELYKLSPQEIMDRLNNAATQFRDTSLFIVACIGALLFTLYVSSALYQRRQKHTDLVNILSKIAKGFLVEFNRANNGQRVCPIDALMEDSFDQILADLGENKTDRSLLLSLWSRVERQVVQDKRISCVKQEVGGKMQRCWRFLDSKAYNTVD